MKIMSKKALEMHDKQIRIMYENILNQKKEIEFQKGFKKGVEETTKSWKNEFDELVKDKNKSVRLLKNDIKDVILQNLANEDVAKLKKAELQERIARASEYILDLLEA